MLMLSGGKMLPPREAMVFSHSGEERESRGVEASCYMCRGRKRKVKREEEALCDGLYTGTAIQRQLPRESRSRGSQISHRDPLDKSLTPQTLGGLHGGVVVDGQSLAHMGGVARTARQGASRLCPHVNTPKRADIMGKNTSGPPAAERFVS